MQAVFTWLVAALLHFSVSGYEGYCNEVTSETYYTTPDSQQNGDTFTRGGVHYWTIKDPFPDSQRLSPFFGSDQSWYHSGTPWIPRGIDDNMDHIGDTVWQGQLSNAVEVEAPDPNDFETITVLGNPESIKGFAYVKRYNGVSANRGYGINFLPMDDVCTTSSKQMQTTSPLYARNGYVRDTQILPADWITMENPVRTPLLFCTCPHTFIEGRQYCQLQDGTCKDQKNIETIQYSIIEKDGKGFQPIQAVGVCNACLNCREHWTLCPKAVLSKCWAWLEPDTWNVTTQGIQEPGKQRFDEMRTFCNAAEPPPPGPQHKPSVEDILLYAAAGLALVLLLLYVGLKMLQANKEAASPGYVNKPTLINNVLWVYEVIPTTIRNLF